MDTSDIITDSLLCSWGKKSLTRFIRTPSCPDPELQRCAQELNSTLNTVSSWSNDSHLALNSKKTKTKLLSTSQMSHVHSLDKNRPAITISDRTLEYVNVSKLLSVHFHQHLNWDEHLQELLRNNTNNKKT